MNDDYGVKQRVDFTIFYHEVMRIIFLKGI